MISKDIYKYAVCTLLLFLSHASLASVDTGTVGGSTGTDFRLTCNENSVLAGFDVRAGTIIHAISARCVSVDSSGLWNSAPYQTGGLKGGYGGSTIRLECPTNYAVSGVQASSANWWFRSVVSGLRLSCKQLISATEVQGSVYSSSIAGRFYTAPQALDCESNQVAIGVIGRSRNLLDKVGLVCGSRSTISPPPSDAKGQWSSIQDWPLIGIHSVLTPQGDVLTFGTDGSGTQGAQFFYDVWNPLDNTHETIDNTLQVDSFCSAPLVIPETGQILMPGGDARFGAGYNTGIVDAPLFDPESKRLSRAADMAYARWYPTATTLPNGEIILTGGIDGASNPSITPEIYSPGTDTWRTLFGARSSVVFGNSDTGWFYPRQWVAPNGEIFGMTGSYMYYLSTTGNGSIQQVGTVPATARNYRSTAVMYEPGKILQVGGEGDTGAISVDINNDTPVVSTVSSTRFNRNSWADSTVMPDGSVIVIGGSPADNQLEGATLTPEKWDPETDTWESLKDAELARLYHSTVLLLPDGRLLVAGGGSPGPLTNLNAEIFSPPYLFDENDMPASRLSIFDAVDTAVHGQNLTITHSTNGTVERVTLIKTGAVTHSFNMDQRFIELDFNASNGQVSVSLPESANIAPPGYYMLFLLNEQGTPSVGHMINIQLQNQTPPDPAPTFVTTDSPYIGRYGGSSFSTDCGPNQVLAGVDVRADYIIRAISARCVSVDSFGNWNSAPYGTMAFNGGAGGALRRLDCPANYAVAGFNGSRAGGWFDFAAGHIQLGCRRLSSPVSVSGSQFYTYSAGIRQSGSAESVACSNDRPARGLYGRSGFLVNLYGLQCLTEQ